MGAPQGRLTLTTGVPVLTTDVTGAATIYYTPYVGDYVPIYNGSTWTMTQFAELSQALSDTAKSPAAAAANSNYDMFVWNDGGTLRCTRGPLWTSDTARGTGAGTTELSRVNGLWTNAFAITNGPGAGLGTYVGTIRTDATPACNMLFAPAAASGGAANRLDVWNAYNRIDVASTNRDSTATWTYNTVTWRARNNNANNGISYVCGLDEDAFSATTDMTASHSTADQAVIGLGLDTTSALHAQSSATWVASNTINKFISAFAALSILGGIGFHTVYPLEQGSGATATWRNNTTGGAGTDARGTMRLSLPM